ALLPGVKDLEAQGPQAPREADRHGRLPAPVDALKVDPHVPLPRRTPKGTGPGFGTSNRWSGAVRSAAGGSFPEGSRHASLRERAPAPVGAAVRAYPAPRRGDDRRSPGRA